MSERDVHRVQEAGRGEDRFSEGGLRAPAHYSTLRKMWWWFDFLILVKLARLRFLAVLTAIGLLIVYWDTLVAYYEKWTRPLSGTEQVAESDTEYFCPMHPQVVTTNPKEKCPICFMNLSKRKKGEAGQQETLPAGVVTRLQFSPYKVAAAGIRTWEAKYEPLAKSLETVGSVEFDERKLARIAARLTGKSRIDKLYANVTGDPVKKGDPLALLYNPDLVVTVQNLLEARRGGNRDLERLARERLQLWGIEPDQIESVLNRQDGATRLVIRSPISGYVTRKYQVEGEYVEEGARLYDVADLSTVWIEAQVYEEDVAFLQVGLPVSARVKAYPDKSFPGKVAFRNPHLDTATRTLRVRFDLDNPDGKLSPGMYATVRIDVPAAEMGKRFPSRDGRVLAIPETAVVHTGSQKLVYREEGPTVFYAVPVELGPLLTGADGGGYYPVIRGLEAGDKVVTVGSYLLDAETRVSASAGSIYTGGMGSGGKAGAAAAAVRPSTPEDEAVKVQSALAKLSTPDRQLAEAQKYCVVLGSRLGSMGTPVKVVLHEQPVFLCCKGCIEEAREHPERALAKLKKGEPQPPAEKREGPAVNSAREAKIRDSLTALGAEDRRLAEAQGFCPVNETRLGVMGKPAKVVLKGQPVFLCCDSCIDEAKADPDKTLTKVKEQKDRKEKGTTKP
jgi:multidrug efflux pump subunit AcrA (membrane-fusion protein)